MTTSRALGLALIWFGVLLLAITTTDLGGELLLPGIGVGLLVAYLATGSYGLLIPGAIVTGLGIGTVAAAQGAPSGVEPLGLGLGFLAIALVSGTRGPRIAGWWWPLIPGGIITVFALNELTDAGPIVLPLALIAAGLVLLVGGRGRRRRRAEQPPPPPEPGPALGPGGPER